MNPAWISLGVSCLTLLVMGGGILVGVGKWRQATSGNAAHITKLAADFEAKLAHLEATFKEFRAEIRRDIDDDFRRIEAIVAENRGRVDNAVDQIGARINDLTAAITALTGRVGKLEGALSRINGSTK